MLLDDEGGVFIIAFRYNLIGLQEEGLALSE
jgi:hypothetical protein